MKKFKYIFLTVITLIICISARGQYKYVPNFDFYVGTWIYESSNEQFILKTKIYSYVFNNERDYVVLGAYKYIKNGNVVYDFLDELDGMTMKNRPRIIFYNLYDLPNNQEHQELRIQYISVTVQKNRVFLLSQRIRTNLNGILLSKTGSQIRNVRWNLLFHTI